MNERWPQCSGPPASSVPESSSTTEWLPDATLRSATAIPAVSPGSTVPFSASLPSTSGTVWLRGAGYSRSPGPRKPSSSSTPSPRPATGPASVPSSGPPSRSPTKRSRRAAKPSTSSKPTTVLPDKILRPLQLEFVKIQNLLGRASGELWNYHLHDSCDSMAKARRMLRELEHRVLTEADGTPYERV